MTRKRLLLFVVGLGLLVLGGLLLLLWSSRDPINWTNFEKIKEEMTEEEVVEIIGLQPGDHATALGLQRRPPGEIVVAEIEDVGCAGCNRHRLGRGDVVDIGGRHHRVDGTVARG